MSFANPSVGSLGWFARHEFNLSWRDFVRMMSAGKPGREKGVIAFIAIAVFIVHAIAYALIVPSIEKGLVVDKSLMAIICGSILLTLSLMMSQALELVTRVFYSRSDLDLILSSPTSAKKVFTIRIGAIACSTSMLSLLLFGSAINILAIFDSPIWLSAYLVVFACGAIATAASLSITILMFKTLGAKRTRLISQIIAAIVGAGFIIGIQLAAISSLGSLSRFEFFSSEAVTNAVPDLNSMLWIPAYAVMGEINALMSVLALSLGALGLAILAFAGKFGEYVITASGVSQTAQVSKPKEVKFKTRSIAATLRHKEWRLLLRDHWLLSQSLMQVLYLIPPAFMLWQNFGHTSSIGIVVIPVMVMATGQLAGGLAWLAISGEDAPQLVQTAPVAKGAIIRAKIEAVLGAIALISTPIIALMAFIEIKMALIAAIGITCATISATMIQLWFRSQAKRSNFRRRQTSSKVATLSEAFSSIMWAGSAALVAGGLWQFAIVTAVLAVGVLWIARSFRPKEEI